MQSGRRPSRQTCRRKPRVTSTCPCRRAHCTQPPGHASFLSLPVRGLFRNSAESHCRKTFMACRPWRALASQRYVPAKLHGRTRSVAPVYPPFAQARLRGPANRKLDIACPRSANPGRIRRTLGVLANLVPAARKLSRAQALRRRVQMRVVQRRVVQRRVVPRRVVQRLRVRSKPGVQEALPARAKWAGQKPGRECGRRLRHMQKAAPPSIPSHAPSRTKPPHMHRGRKSSGLLQPGPSHARPRGRQCTKRPALKRTKHPAR